MLFRSGRGANQGERRSVWVLGDRFGIRDSWELESEPKATLRVRGSGGMKPRREKRQAKGGLGRGYTQRWESKPSPVMVSSSSSLIRISSSHNSSGWEAEASRGVVGPGARGEAATSGPGGGE